MTPTPPSKAWLARLRKLDTRKGREEENRFLAEGWKIVRECLQARLNLHGLLVAEPQLESDDLGNLLAAYDLSEIELFTLPQSQFKKAASTRSPQGVIGVFGRSAPPSLKVLEEVQGIVVVLDEVQDPGNVGTAIRCAAGLGAQAVILLGACADVWNPKTLRAGAGALFRLPVLTCVDANELDQALVVDGFAVWIAAAEGSPVGEIEDFPDRLAIVFGNESRGAGLVWETFPDAKKVGLPLARGVESLNVGTAVAAMLGALSQS